MAPYNPPNASHYSQMSLDAYTPDDIFAFVGRNWKRFYWLTRVLGLDYLWYDDVRHVIEIWGPYYTHTNKQSEHLIRAELEYFKNKNLSGEEYSVLSSQDDEHFEETPNPHEGEAGGEEGSQGGDSPRLVLV